MDENVAPETQSVDPNATQQADPVSETAAPETPAAPEETTPEKEFATYTQEQLADHSERLNALESELAGFKQQLHDAGIRLVT